MIHFDNSFSNLAVTPVNKSDEKPWSTRIGKDTVDLDMSLAKWLGRRLGFLARHSHSHPAHYESNEWKQTLFTHAFFLLEYAKLRRDQTDVTKYDVFVAKAKEAIKFCSEELDNLWS